jgi:hypothetical protein
MIRGNLDRLHLGDLLHWLELGGQSGRLTLTDATGERRFDLIHGRIIFVSSTIPEERLATWLARDGLLPAEKTRRLLATAMLRHQLFTDVLLDAGVITETELGASLTVLAELMTSRILNSSELRFELEPDHAVCDPSGINLSLTPSRLLLDSARRVDESRASEKTTGSRILPLDEEAVEHFFWQLIQAGIPSDDPVDGDQLNALHDIIRNVMASLAQWLTSSTGLVPQPADHAQVLAAAVDASGSVRLHGFPHAAWNQMVLACAVRSADLTPPVRLSDLDRFASSLNLWPEITSSERWQRGGAGRLDRLTRRVSIVWSRGAEAAAEVLGVEPGAAELAAHLITIPTDLVLWVLGALPVPHQGIRRALLNELPRRIGAGLGHLADLPLGMRQVFEGQVVTELGICLHVSRSYLPSSAAWPRTVPDNDTALLDLVTPLRLQRAATAAHESMVGVASNPV